MPPPCWKLGWRGSLSKWCGSMPKLTRSLERKKAKQSFPFFLRRGSCQTELQRKGKKQSRSFAKLCLWNKLKRKGTNFSWLSLPRHTISENQTTIEKRPLALFDLRCCHINMTLNGKALLHRRWQETVLASWKKGELSFKIFLVFCGGYFGICYHSYPILWKDFFCKFSSLQNFKSCNSHLTVTI